MSNNIKRRCLLDSLEKNSSKNGIALIMVLGLLAVMVILAVTFAISMRTERLAAGNYADHVRARELTYVALARALDDLRVMFHMPDQFVVSGLDSANKTNIVLIGSDQNYEAGDEVRVYSVGTLPGALPALNDGTTYAVSSKGPDQYTISLRSGVTVVNFSDLGNFKPGLNISDSYDGGKVSSNRSYVAGTPVKRKSSGAQYYVVPVDDTQIKLASSYSNAVQGNATMEPWVDTIELIPVHGIYPVMTIQSVDNDQLVYSASRQRLRTGMAVRIGINPTIYYVRTVKNELTLWYIQLCTSYANALANRPISIASVAEAVVGNLIIPVPSVSPHSPAFASYGTNTVVSLSDFSEPVTNINAVSDTVNVVNRYRSGAVVAFTTTGTLPSPLNEKKSYYAVPGAGGTIYLAETLDKALAAIPTVIDLTSDGFGTHRIYELGLSGEATNYIPMAVYTNAAEALANATSNGFFEIRTKDTDLMGKVRYAIVDCSGLLDANYVGGAAARSYGNDPQEFTLENLLELAGVLAATFKTDRTIHKRYETLLDLYQHHRPSDMFVYSYSLPEQWDTNLMSLPTPLNIGDTDMDKLRGKYSAITNGLCMAGFTPEEANVVYSNLLDFVDSDSFVTNLDCSVENVPMINEAQVAYNIVVDNGTTPGTKKYTVNGSVSIECWYPFVTDAALSFNLNSAVSFVEAQNIKPDTLNANDDLIGTPVAGSFKVITRICPQKVFDNMSPPIKLISTFSLKVKLATGETVDQVLNLTVTNYHDGIISSNTFADIECLDPRFNANPNDPNQWKQMGSTNNVSLSLPYTNTWTKSFLSSANDGDSAMYVGNRQLRSVGELGYLVYSPNAPWKTVKLYGPNRHRVLDVFAISKDLNDRFAHTIYNRGQINPNTKLLDVMKAWFQGMLVNKYPEQTVALGAHELNATEAGTVAGYIQAQAGSYTNLSEIGRVFDDTTKFPYPTDPASASELERESYFRNTCGLFNVHQSVFTILLEAKVAAGGNIPMNPTRQRAIAIVWRDPFTGEMFIRHIKWLGD